MPDNQPSLWNRMGRNIRTRLLSGVLILVPFGVTLLVMRWLFGWMAGILRTPVADAFKFYGYAKAISDLSPNAVGAVDVIVSIISILILLVLLYLIGAIGHYVTGEKLLALGEAVLLRIPLVRTIYSASKQVMEAVSLPDRSAFKSVVLVDFPLAGHKALAFLTGYILDTTGRKCCKIYVPTALNPTSGFVQILPVEEVIPLTMSVEEAFKVVISGGILAPDALQEGRHPAG